MTKTLQVVGAVVMRDGKVMCTQRPPGGPIGNLWEFPGGKIEPGETPEQALIRECAEELGIIVQPGNQITSTTMEYPRGPITLTTYYCELLHGEPTLTEHVELRWLKPAELPALAWAPLDLPTVTKLL